jgi:hypothetical protein
VYHDAVMAPLQLRLAPHSATSSSRPSKGAMFNLTACHVELEIKSAQLQHAYARPRHQREAM